VGIEPNDGFADRRLATWLPVLWRGPRCSYGWRYLTDTRMSYITMSIMLIVYKQSPKLPPNFLLSYPAYDTNLYNENSASPTEKLNPIEY
jgi:hypothetical protein